MIWTEFSESFRICELSHPKCLAKVRGTDPLERPCFTMKAEKASKAIPWTNVHIISRCQEQSQPWPSSSTCPFLLIMRAHPLHHFHPSYLHNILLTEPLLFLLLCADTLEMPLKLSLHSRKIQEQEKEDMHITCCRLVFLLWFASFLFLNGYSRRNKLQTGTNFLFCCQPQRLWSLNLFNRLSNISVCYAV